MLNRRMYAFPCRRDMPIAAHIHQLLDIYEEYKMKKGDLTWYENVFINKFIQTVCFISRFASLTGVILTLPKYRLSFKLKLYESIQKGDKEMANGI